MSLSAPIRLGLVGYGAWGRFHARSIKQAQNAELVAIAVPSAESRQAAQTDFPDVEIFESHQSLIENAETDIVTPTANHFDAAIAALEAGWDSFFSAGYPPSSGEKGHSFSIT